MGPLPWSTDQARTEFTRCCLSAMAQVALRFLGETLTAITTDLPRLMLTVREAAEILHVGRSTVYSLMDSGELESVHIGRLRRIPMQAVTDYIERKRAET